MAPELEIPLNQHVSPCEEAKLQPCKLLVSGSLDFGTPTGLTYKWQIGFAHSIADPFLHCLWILK